MIKNESYFLKIRPYVNINYMIHDIPSEKMDLVLASDKEYESMNFNLVSKKEAKKLLSFYGNKNNFRKQCFDVIEMIKKERGKVSLLDEENLNI